MDQKKGEDIQVYDVSESLQVADWFVVATGLNRPHVRALLDDLHLRLKAAGEPSIRVEGAESGWWVLIDHGDVVIHLLQADARAYYDLDRLYQDCERLDWRAVELPELPLHASQRTGT